MSDLVQVYASGDAFAGQLMKGRLETEGIDVIIKGEAEGPYRMGPVYLWVASEDEAAAIAIVDAVSSGAFALGDEEDLPADAGNHAETGNATDADP